MVDRPAVIGPAELVRQFFRRPWHWLIPTVAVAALAGAGWLVRGDRWEATQAWSVRIQASGNAGGPGTFRPEELKTAQETIQELVKNRSVLAEALQTCGPPDGYQGTSWPTAADVADVRDRVKLAAPEGAQLGTTEIFYLHLRDRCRPRSIVLAAAIGRHVEARFQELSNIKAASMIAELREAVALAAADLREATERLAAKEREVGSNLGELRILSEALSNNSDLRQRTIDVENELRAARTANRATQQLLELLREAHREPSRFLAMPNSLLEAQPSLKRLKEGLVDAQLRTAQAQGSMTAAHPAVQAVQIAEVEVRQKLAKELDVAIRGIEADLEISGDRVALLEAKLEESRLLLTRLAGERAGYANLVNEVKNRTRLLEQAQTTLVGAQAIQAGARSGGWLTRIDEPDPGDKPVGPSLPVMIAAGAAAGLALGLGLLVLTCPPAIVPVEAQPELVRLPANGRSHPAPSTIVYRRIAVSNGHDQGAVSDPAAAQQRLPLKSES